MWLYQITLIICLFVKVSINGIKCIYIHQIKLLIIKLI